MNCNFRGSILLTWFLLSSDVVVVVSVAVEDLLVVWLLSPKPKKHYFDRNTLLFYQTRLTFNITRSYNYPCYSVEAGALCNLSNTTHITDK